MRILLFLRAAALCSLFGLAACMGGGGAGTDAQEGGTTTPPDPRLARLDAYGAQATRILGDPVGGIDAMPMTEDIPAEGTVTFTGSATLRVELPGDPLVLYGDAVVQTDFMADMTEGTLDNFFGGTAGGGIADFEGSVALTGGALQQDSQIVYQGALAANGHDLTLDGVLTTALLGEPLGAIAAADLEGQVDYNGTTQDATLIVLGEGTVIPPPPPPD
ncbi:MAG: hypothetical protein ACSHW1_05640 [Yoonia sp.]|uniref:hypothetical protein n=1 Tax=Yoonia sp. TaxID=2212373 RepID=UPI003EF120EB